MQARAGRLRTAPPLIAAGGPAVGAWASAAAALVAVTAVTAIVTGLARRPDWAWPVDEPELGHRQLAVLDPARADPASRLSARYGVALLVLFAAAFAIHLVVVVCRAPVPGRPRPRVLAAASALVVAVLLAGIGRLGPPPLGWLARWGLVADAAVLAIALGVAATRSRPVRVPAAAGSLALAAAVAALAAVPLLHMRLSSDREPIVLLAQLPAGGGRLDSMVASLSGSADVARVQVRRTTADPSWAILEIDPGAGVRSADARALVRYLREDRRGFTRLVTGSAARQIEADRMADQLPWLAGWFLVAAVALPALARTGRDRRQLPRGLAAPSEPLPAVAVAGGSLVADEQS